MNKQINEIQDAKHTLMQRTRSNRKDNNVKQIFLFENLFFLSLFQCSHFVDFLRLGKQIDVIHVIDMEAYEIQRPRERVKRRD